VTVRDQVPPGRKVLMHISNFRPVKRVRDVVRIFAHVARAMPSVLVMVGDGPERVAAEKEAESLGVSDQTVFLGRLDTIAPLLAGADLFLLPTERESFGLSALEALACGVPVIGARAGGLPEVVQDGVTGVLRDVGDVEGMSAAAVDILASQDRWQAMSDAAAADARTRFSQNDVVTRYEDFYTRVLG
jgi:N-acetyl-alpha-D-glucosaminyl L-malate synthase BshA